MSLNPNRPEVPVAVYNSDEAKLIGIFSTATKAAFFICGKYHKNPVGALNGALKSKSRMLPKSTQLTIPVAVRRANAGQIAQLPDEGVLLCDNTLSIYLESIPKGFTEMRDMRERSF